MAEFNPGIPDTPTRDWTSASRGPGVNKSLQTLFDGIGDAVGGAVQTADTYIQNRIEDDARTAFDSLNDETNLSVDTVPTDITRSSDGLAKLAAAHSQGKITQEYYHARLASTLKGLRSKYPGYEKEVDSIMQKVTGTRPANAYRDALLQNLDTLQKQQADSQSKIDTFIRNNAKYLNPDEINSPEKYGSDTLVKNIQKRQAQEYGFEYEKNLIQSNQRNAGLVFNQKLSYETNETLNSVGAAIGLTADQNISVAMKNLVSQGGLSPEKKVEVLAGLDRLVLTQRAKLFGYAADPAFASMTPQEKDTQISASLKPIQDLRALIESDDYDSAAILLGRSKLAEGRALDRLYGEHPDAALAKALQGIDPASASLIMNGIITRSGGERKFTESILSSDLGLLGATGVRSLSESVSAVAADVNISQKEKNRVITDTVDNFVRNVTTVQMDPAKVEAMVQQNYSSSSTADKLWSLVTPDQKLQLYQKMFSPEITKKIFEQGSDAAKAMYQNAAVDRLVNVPEFKAALDDLNGTIDYARFARVNYDPGSNRINISVNQDGIRNQGIFQRSTQEKWNADLAQFAGRFNQALSIMAPIIEASGGDEMENMSQLFKTLNLQVEGGDQKGFFYWVNTVLDNSIANASGENPRSLLTEPNTEDFVPVTLPDGRTVEIGDGNLEFDIPSLPQLNTGALARAKDGPNTGILDLIGRTEGTDRGASYNETLGYGAFTNGPVNLTEMTLSEVRNLQRQMLRHPQNRWNSSAVGRYQIVGTTLQDAMKELGLKGTEKFTPALQDRIATHLLEKRGLSRWKSGEMSDQAFLNSLAREWASLPTARGVGAYPGQRASANPSEVLGALQQ